MAMFSDEPKAESGYWTNMGGGGNSTSTLSGVKVNEDRVNGLSAYYACLRVVSEDVGKLPLNVYRKTKGGGKEIDTDNPIQWLLHSEPNNFMTSMIWRASVTANALGHGMGYSHIQRNALKEPIGFFPIESQRVEVEVVGKGSMQELIYKVSKGTGKPDVIKAKDMLVIPNLGSNGLVGWSVLKIAAQSLGLTIAAQDFGASFFGNGAALKGVLTVNGKLKDDGRKRLRNGWNDLYSGVNNSCKTAILEDGATYSALTIPPNDAQFLETRNFQVEEIARWFRVPPNKIQHLLHATFSNVEQENLSYTNDTLKSWLIKWEQEINRKLFAESKGEVFAEHNMNALLRGDQAARSAFYTSLFNLGSLSPNEIRGFENQNPIPDGDNYFVQMNMTTLDRAVAGEVAGETEEDTVNTDVIPNDNTEPEEEMTE